MSGHSSLLSRPALGRMWRLLLVCCCAALAAGGSQDASPGKMTEDGGEKREGERQPTAEPLEEELDNQENIISQVSNPY